jgi:ATP-dependent Clp protease ATP-binding subunit ClpC
MFDKFSESARRVVFYARGRASVFGTEMITPELLLLGMLRENALDVSRLIGGEADGCEGLRKQIEENIPRGKPIPTSIDMPISKELGLVFQHAIEEASGIDNETVQPGHLLAGILREEGCYATQVLRANGAELSIVRQRLLKSH